MLVEGANGNQRYNNTTARCVGVTYDERKGSNHLKIAHNKRDGIFSKENIWIHNIIMAADDLEWSDTRLSVAIVFVVLFYNKYLPKQY